MTADLAVKACLNAKSIEEIILHINLGVMFDSFRQEGILYDNACIESFHSLLKKEEINRDKCPDFDTDRKAVFEYIETCYKRNGFIVHQSYEFQDCNEDD